MFRTRLTRRIAAVIATLAILMAALAPSVSHALVGKADSLWAEICSAAGIKLVKVPAADADPAHHKTAGTFEHCPFCSSHAGMAVLPPTSIILMAVSSSLPHPVLFYQAPHPLFVWASAQSRAPPANS